LNEYKTKGMKKIKLLAKEAIVVNRVTIYEKFTELKYEEVYVKIKFISSGKTDNINSNEIIEKLLAIGLDFERI